jgi:hypothetical protein
MLEDQLANTKEKLTHIRDVNFILKQQIDHLQETRKAKDSRIVTIIQS